MNEFEKKTGIKQTVLNEIIVLAKKNHVQKLIYSVPGREAILKEPAILTWRWRAAALPALHQILRKILLRSWNTMSLI